AQAQSGTAPGWKGYGTSPLYFADPVAACADIAQKHFGTPLEFMKKRPEPALARYDCYYHHFLGVGDISNWGWTDFTCVSSLDFATPEGTCVPQRIQPSPPIAICTGNCFGPENPNAGRGEANSGMEMDRTEGNPVVLSLGMKFQQFRDFESGGQKPLALTRYYRSGLQRGGMSLGQGWSTTFDRFIILNSATSPSAATVSREDGTYLNYTYFSSSNTWFASTNDVVAKIARVGTTNTYTFTDENDRVDTFELPAGAVAPFIARLVSSRTRDGYVQTLAYDANGKLATVTDSFGRVLAFTWTGDVATQIDTPGGLSLKYTYTRLLNGGVPVSGTEKLTGFQSSLADGSQSVSHAYLYETATIPTALTGFTDERGVRFATWTYDSLGRVTASEHAGGVEHAAIAYDETARTRTVTNPLGSQTIYRFLSAQNRNKLSRIERQASANVPAANGIQDYTSRGFVNSITDFKGVRTTFVRDTTTGEETSRTEASATAQARTVTTTWHATLRVPTRIVEPGRTIDLAYDASGRLTQRTETDTTTQNVPYSTNGRTRSWAYTYTATGLLASVDGPRTDVTDLTQYSYDAAGNLTQVANALGQATTITSYNARALPLTIVDANQVQTDLAYDVRGRLTGFTVHAAAGDAATGFAYDAAGLVTRVTRPDGSYLDYTYDDARRLIRAANTATTTTAT
ncbi:MAG: RHS repeat protein, partial [Proteobacteria bacterium]|nr:RHS repeat protein [Pseudomonadota bacterium]